MGEFAKDAASAPAAPAPVAAASASAEDEVKNSIEKGMAGFK
jgi:hypothetical protein